MKVKNINFVNFQPLVICGPSGSGKSTLIQKLLKEFPNNFAFSVSHTTREKRPSETEGIHYYYITKEKFIEKRERNEFLENAEYAGNFYGTSYGEIDSIMKRNKIPLLDIEMKGILMIKENKRLDANFILIEPPSIEELKRRLTNRGDTSQEAMQKRLERAIWELSFKGKGIFDYSVVNDKVEEAYQNLRNVIADIQSKPKSSL